MAAKIVAILSILPRLSTFQKGILMTRKFIFALLLASLPLCAATPSKVLKNLDATVRRTLQTFNVPGIALAIVHDGEVVLAKGYGVRRLGETTPVDGQTLFAIASNTKAFTATALGLLVEEGKLQWDAPVIRYLPAFRLSDPWVTAEITIRDLLVHRSGLGLGAGDLLWWPPTDYSREEIVRRLQFLPLARSFRSAYAYDNVLYTVAGQVIETVSGQSWEDFIRSRILTPAGMTHSLVRRSEILTAANVATPHAEIDGTLQIVKPFVNDNVGAAGAIISCADDMAQWMIVQLDSGRLADGARLFKSSTTRQLWGYVTPRPIYDPPSQLAPLRANFLGYALGFELRDYRGFKLVSHTGGLPGYVSRLALIPEKRLGVMVLTNQESGYAFNALVYDVLDRFLAAPAFDWVGAYARVKTKADSSQAGAEQNTLAARNTDSKPSLPLAQYAGTYADAWYGDIVIETAGQGLVMRFTRTPSLVGDLEHWQYDTFVARWRDRELRADAFVTFALTPEGRIDCVQMKAVSQSTDFSFDFQDLLLKPKSDK